MTEANTEDTVVEETSAEDTADALFDNSPQLKENVVEKDDDKDAPVADEEVAAKESEEEVKEADKDGEDADKSDDDKTPEAFKDFEIPEEITINEEALSSFKDLAKDMELSQEQAQQLVDLQTKMAIQEAKQRDEEFNDSLAEMLEAAKTDKDIGGDKFETKVASAMLAIETFGDQNVIDALDYSGLGNHPGILKMLSAVGELVQEDRIHGSAGAKTNEITTEQQLADELYPSMAK